MSKSLVIVESPAKAKTINKYLGSDYPGEGLHGARHGSSQERAGGGRRSRLPADLHPIPTRKDVIAELKSAASKADAIYLAADPDREGEAICQHLHDLLNSSKTEVLSRPVQ